MKVCILNYSDGRGGANVAAYRLHQGLRHFGVDSKMLVDNKNLDDYTVLSPDNNLEKGWTKFAPSLDTLPKILYSQRERSPYSLAWLPDRIIPKIARIAPDILNLHWINSGYLQIETLAKFKQPLVWTLHDMWPFTGGCHYSQECDRYTKTCGSCPELHSNKDWDLSRWVWQRKAKAWKNLNLTIVTPSNWLAQCAKASSLFQNLRIEVIPNGLDTQKYKPIDRQLAKNMLGLPSDKKIVLFGAIKGTNNFRKGFHLLLPALQKLSQSGWQERIELVIFGSSEPNNAPKFGFKANYLGKLNDDISLSLLYAAADIFVAPSIQENLPNTLIESLACGTPCVAFKIGGIPDTIEQHKNGYLAEPFDIEDLAKGIAWVLEDEERHQKLSFYARKKIEQEFSQELQIDRYLSIFNDLIVSI